MDYGGGAEGFRQWQLWHERLYAGVCDDSGVWYGPGRVRFRVEGCVFVRIPEVRSKFWTTATADECELTYSF